MKKIVYICIVAMATACNSKTDFAENKNYTLQGDTIIISDNSVLKSKLSIETVKTELYHKKITTSGIVKAIPNNYAQIAAPFSGRITKSFVKLGQKVKVGSPIFEISSPDFNEACMVYFQAKQEMQLADKNLKRQRDLFENGVGVKKDLEEAEVNFELTKRDFENSIASLNVYNVNSEEIVLGQPLIIRSPIQGEIVENNIVIGQYMKEDAEPVAVVAELSKVWVVGQLKEKDISSIHESDEVEIKLPCLSDKIIKGKVYHISEILDEDTRSVQVFIECDNSDRIMKPGMYVSVQFSNPEEIAMLISEHSVLQQEKSSFVFVHLRDNKYIKRNIEIEGIDNKRLVLKSGLKPNEEIICEGGFYLLEAI